jgi:hypothetical protein
VANRVFRSFHKESRPLSAHLAQRFLRPLVAQVQTLTLDQLPTDGASHARALAEAARVRPPEIVAPQAARAGDEGEARPTVDPTVKVRTTRFYVAVEMRGDLTLLDHWPDETGQDLLPVDHGLGDWTRPAPDAPFDWAAALRRHQSLLAQDRWTINTRDSTGPELLYMFLDLTDDEIEQVHAGARDPRAEVDAALDRVRPIVDAVARQTQAYFDERLPDELTRQLEARRRRLEGHRRVVQNLSWPDGWKARAPALEPARTAPQPGSGTEVPPKP